MTAESGPAPRNLGFGDRVRAARGLAGGMSQSELAGRIQKMFPGVEVSARTIKRVEAEDPAVRGSLEQWATWVGTATETPIFFLEYGFSDLDQAEMMRTRWEHFTLIDWLRIGARALWLMQRQNTNMEVRRALLRRLRRDGGIPFGADEIRSPGFALSTMHTYIKKDQKWMYEKVAQLLSDYGVDHPGNNDDIYGPPYITHETVKLLRAFIDNDTLTDSEMARLREFLYESFAMEIDPQGMPQSARRELRDDLNATVELIARLMNGDALADDEMESLRRTFTERPEMFNGIDWGRALRGEPQFRTDLEVIWGEASEERETERLLRLGRLHESEIMAKEVRAEMAQAAEASRPADDEAQESGDDAQGEGEIVLFTTRDPRTGEVWSAIDARASRSDGKPWLLREGDEELAFATRRGLRQHYEKTHPDQGTRLAPTRAPRARGQGPAPSSRRKAPTPPSND